MGPPARRQFGEYGGLDSCALADTPPLTAMVFYNQHVFFEVIPYLQRLGIAVSRDFSAAVCEFTRHSAF